MKNINLKKWRTGLMMLMAGVFIGWLVFGGTDPAEPAAGNEEVVHDHKDEDQTYTCSMHPQIRQSEPGQCPICGMDLIPVSEQDQSETADPQAVKMTKTATQLADIRTSEVTKVRPVKNIDLTGKIAVDNRKVFSQPVHVPGRIEQLHVNFEGERVRKGQKIASVYSPALISAQRELREAGSMEGEYSNLLESAKNKLRLWKLSESQIESLQNAEEIQTTFDITADVSGILYKRKLNPGDYVKTGDVLYTVANIDRVWVNFDAYESDLPWITEGDTIRFTVPSIPGKTFTSRVTFIDPVLNKESRSVTIRTEVSNERGLLKPEMFANGQLTARLSEDQKAVVVPASSVMWTGKRSVVFVEDTSASQTAFLMREVTLGPSLGDAFVVEEGLHEGERVVTQGTFSVDAAAQLAGKPSMMRKNPDGGKAGTGHDHGGMEMNNSNESNTPSPEFQGKVQDIIQNYLEMKDALVEDNPEAVQKQAQAFLNESGTMGAELKNSYQELSSPAEIEEQRRHFADLSVLLYHLVKQENSKESPLYWSHCPMANDNDGANWLSREEAISNPYMGQDMPGCGTVEETIP